MWPWILGGLSGLLLLTTLLPLSRRQEWWIRGWDFPRFQLAAISAVVLLASVFLLDRGNPWTWAIVVSAAFCAIYQAWWIAPYTPFSPKEVRSRADSGERLRLMTANVLMTNPNKEAFLALVREVKPDVLVTLETNAKWEQRLAALESEFPHTVKCPLENLYGMHLYSRLPLEDTKLQFLVEEDVPSIHTLLVLPSGRRVRLHCLHPAPPSPTENETSQERDAELVMVGKSVVGAKFPVLVAGDLNDVAWSATTRLFRQISGLLDPRIGRGFYSTFHARYPFCRWPVDHFFHSRHFSCVEIMRLPACGSDHFSVLVELALTDEAQGSQLSADHEDEKEAREKMATEAVDESQVHQPGERRELMERG